VRAVLDGEIFAPADDTPVDSFAQPRRAAHTPAMALLALDDPGRPEQADRPTSSGVGEATVKAHVT